MGFFRNVQFLKKQIVGYNYGTLVYTTSSNNPQKNDMFGDGVMGLKVSDLNKLIMELKDIFKSADGVNSRTCIVPDP